MEYQSTIQVTKMATAAEFQAVRNTYPSGESLYCHVRFDALSACQPEAGDWIGIFKAGWIDLRDYASKKIVKEGDIWSEGERYVQVCFPGKHAVDSFFF
jgi:hypothetical protein